MNVQAVVDAFKAQSGNVAPVGAKIKFVLDDQPIVIDGTGEANTVTTDDVEADCTVKMSFEDFLKLKDGELNPMMAVFSGKIKVSGDMSLALKLQSLLK